MGKAARAYLAARRPSSAFLDRAALSRLSYYRRLPPPGPPLFPYTTLFRSLVVRHRHREGFVMALARRQILVVGVVQRVGPNPGAGVDRKRAKIGRAHAAIALTR